MMADPRLYDISIVLNLHNEANFLQRTLWSLEETTRFAQHQGLTVEIVVVLDRADAATRNGIKRYSFPSFSASQVIEVDNGSLGLSRNDGILIARGNYIALADGDDLVSYNYLYEAYLSVKDEPTKSIAIPEYLYAFGDNRHIVKYFGSEYIDKTVFFQYHPYNSRSFCHFSIYRNLLYLDFRLSSGFAYEDWHFNCEAIVRGCIFVTAPDTTLFYRQRSRSLVRQAMSVSANVTGWSSLFEPQAFVKLKRANRDALILPEPMEGYNCVVGRDFFNDALLSELATAASYIDPAIDPYENQHIFSFYNIKTDINISQAYYRLCLSINDKIFSDIVLLPCMTSGRDENFILNFISTLAMTDTTKTFLFLGGEGVESHAWLDKLPENALFLDLFHETETCGEGAVELITLRLIQWVGKNCTLFLNNSIFVDRFFRIYGHLVNVKSIIYFRSLDPMVLDRGRVAFRGNNFNFLSEFGNLFSMIISDNMKIIDHDCNRIPQLREKYHLLYAECSSKRVQAVSSDRTFSGKLLWASRSASEKRPDLLFKIGHLLSSSGSTVVIDVYGSSMPNAFNPDNFNVSDNIEYRGAFTDFDDLPFEDYDGLIYTSLYDGLPNVVLEAMAAGLVVLAADVGGVSEAITPETGILIENSSDDEALAGNFVHAIKSIYNDEGAIAKLRAGAAKLILERHSKTAYVANVKALLGAELDR